LRALSLEQFAAAKKAMQDIVAQSLPQTSATLTFDDGYPPLAPTPGNERLLTLYNRASLDVGAGTVVAVDPDKAGAADVSFIAGQARMILDGVGLMGTGGHTVNETADLRTLPSMAKRMAVLLARLQRDGAK
jgi:glutamate carboxypeptidase